MESTTSEPNLSHHDAPRSSSRSRIRSGMNILRRSVVQSIRRDDATLLDSSTSSHHQRRKSRSPESTAYISQPHSEADYRTSVQLSFPGAPSTVSGWRSSQRKPGESSMTLATLDEAVSHPPALSTIMVQPTAPDPRNLSPGPYRSRKEKAQNNEQMQPRHPYNSSRRHNHPLIEEPDKDKERISAEKHVFSGPLAIAEFERMKKEIEVMKKALHDSKKTVKKQAKRIEELKQEVNVGVMAKAEKDREMSALKSKMIKNDELVTSIESSVQCQICMDIPQKPYALAPCGHILCLVCLQEWFRKAPPSIEDMDIDPEDLDNPYYIVNRPKSCPCCRSIVKHRPAPVFMVKAISSALMRAKASSNGNANEDGPVGTSSDADNDPWEGIFPLSDEEENSDEDDSSDVFEDAVQWAFRGAYPLGFDYDDSASDSDEEDDDDEDDDNEEDDGDDDEEEDYESDGDPGNGVYVPARWEPPRVIVNPRDYVVEDHEGSVVLDLLRRGCSWVMIRNYRMSYAHDTGIVAHVRSLDSYMATYDEGDEDENVSAEGDRIFLGWNIRLRETDVDGEAFMEFMLTDIKFHPERWAITPRPLVPDAYDAKKLVRADDGEEYITTDTDDMD